MNTQMSLLDKFSLKFLLPVSMKDTTLVHQCLDILKRDDVRNELKGLFMPAIELILTELAPYIYVIIGIIFSIFVMILAILILLILVLRNKGVVSKLF
jgi:hypothetical protein